MSYENTLEQLKLSRNFRSIPHADSGNRSIVDFSLNDYLGIASRADLQEEFFDDPANRRSSLTASASRLLAADQTDFHRLESFLSTLYGNRPVLLFNSGYHANTGMVSALASEKGTIVVADKLVHASIIDGLAIGKARFQRFVHNDFDRLERIVSNEHQTAERVLVIVEAVYSMNGDRTDLDTLVSIKKRYPKVMLYVDEAHSLGVLGEMGLGMCRSHKAFRDIDVIIGTLGKACASSGAFAVTSPTLHDYSVNRARSLIFSTALPPLQCRWTQFVFERILTMDHERRKLQALASQLSTAIGLDSPRYIAPFIIGSAQGALDASARLLDQGMKVLPIRTPTVPPGTERLRISLGACMDSRDIERLAASLKEIRQ